jgi:hypothetical protein
MNAESYIYGDRKLVEGYHQAWRGVVEHTVALVQRLCCYLGRSVKTAKPHHSERGQNESARKCYEDEH